MDQQGGRSRRALRGAEALPGMLASGDTYCIDKLTQEQIAADQPLGADRLAAVALGLKRPVFV